MKLSASVHGLAGSLDQLIDPGFGIDQGMYIDGAVIGVRACIDGLCIVFTRDLLVINRQFGDEDRNRRI